MILSDFLLMINSISQNIPLSSSMNKIRKPEHIYGLQWKHSLICQETTSNRFGFENLAGSKCRKS